MRVPYRILDQFEEKRTALEWSKPMTQWFLKERQIPTGGNLKELSSEMQVELDKSRSCSPWKPSNIESTNSMTFTPENIWNKTSKKRLVLVGKEV